MSNFSNLNDLIRAAGLETTLDQTVKKRFMLVGTHAHQTTGYSKVTYHIIQELAKNDKIELYHFGFQKFVDSPPDYRAYPAGVDVYNPVTVEKEEKAPKEMGFGYSQLPDYVRKVKPHVILIYNDAGVICQFLDKLDTLAPEERNYKMIIYLDQVYITQRIDMLQRMDKSADVFFAFTEYWKTILAEQGIKKPIHVLRHGFDPTQFKPMDRALMRQKHKIPESVFLFLNLNRNTPRKRHDIVVTAFAELVARHPAKPLGLLAVCDRGEHGGFPILEIYVRELARRKVPIEFHINKLMITNTAMTYTDETINEMYAMADVGITAADGEGFGLCQFEAMGVGTPQVVSHIGGFRDFCTKENSMLVEPKMTCYIPNSQSGVGGMIEIIDPIELANAAETYMMDSELRKEHGMKARETVLKYKWADEVAELARVILSL
jgi:glycosyltransferase involved in cell wall biosynthesis